MSICVWKHLRKTITSMTENNFHQVHRRLEEKLFKLQFVNKKELRCFKTSGAWTFDPSTFFLSNAGLRKFSENRHFAIKTSLSSHHRRQPLKPTVRKICSTFRHLEEFSLVMHRALRSTSASTTAIKFEATFHHHDLVKVIWRSPKKNSFWEKSQDNEKKLEDFLRSTLRRFSFFFSRHLEEFPTNRHLENFRMLNN